jgi:hypothetical protein
MNVPFVTDQERDKIITDLASIIFPDEHYSMTDLALLKQGYEIGINCLLDARAIGAYRETLHPDAQIDYQPMVVAVEENLQKACQLIAEVLVRSWQLSHHTVDHLAKGVPSHLGLMIGQIEALNDAKRSEALAAN